MFLFRVFQTFNRVIIQTSGYVAGVLAVIPWRPTSIWSSNIINISEYKPDPPGRFQREQRRNQNLWCNSAPEPEHFKATTSDTFLDLHRTPHPPSFFFVCSYDGERHSERNSKVARNCRVECEASRRGRGYKFTQISLAYWSDCCYFVHFCYEAVSEIFTVSPSSQLRLC